MGSIVAFCGKIIRKLICQHDYRMNWDVPRNETNAIILNIGCGGTKKKGVFGIDCLLEVRPDIAADVENGLPIRSQSVDLVYANHVLEHVQNLEGLLGEIYRILRPEGCLRLFVPHFSNAYGHSDYTHKRLFGVFTFSYFTPAHLQRSWRRVPNYEAGFPFEVTCERLRFYSPLRFAWPIVVFLELIVNSNEIFRSFYEYHFCYLFPAYGIQVEMRPIARYRH
jgi:SAM-dependent methyltransferase